MMFHCVPVGSGQTPHPLGSESSVQPCRSAHTIVLPHQYFAEVWAHCKRGGAPALPGRPRCISTHRVRGSEWRRPLCMGLLTRVYSAVASTRSPLSFGQQDTDGLLLATDEHLSDVLLCACPRTAITQYSTRGRGRGDGRHAAPQWPRKWTSKGLTAAVAEGSLASGQKLAAKKLSMMLLHSTAANLGPGSLPLHCPYPHHNPPLTVQAELLLHCRKMGQEPPPPPHCNSYALVQATAGVGSVLIGYLI